MHRIKYSMKELLDLQGHLPLKPSIIFNDTPSSILSTIITSTYTSNSEWGYTWLSGWSISNSLQRRIHKKDPESVYLILREQLKTKRKILQHTYQTLYHMPYTELALQLSHSDETVRAITAWRLELGR